ncbi:MAG TPA: aminopeptidase P family protein [Ignavibacteria bacterium]|nr:aminopeptidase P family protein [Ignavibacteria bacterium]HMR39517.1 aminopeptidase P family protein [Ignavibacteria bacterium]
MTKEQKEFHKSRRVRYAELLGKDSLSIIFGNTARNKSHDGSYDFKQSKNFYYLTGFTEPNSALVIAPSGFEINSGKVSRMFNEALFVQKKDQIMETWDGKRLGYNNVKRVLDIDHGFVNEELSKILSSRNIYNFRRLYINFAEMITLGSEIKRIISDFLNSLNVIAPNIEIADASFLLGVMRSVKTKYEIDEMKKACEISVNAYKDTMKKIKPEIYEYEVQANLEYQYKVNGSSDNAYSPIVAGGENACILHYDSNNKKLKNGDLLLIDSGAEFEYYCSDITRTYPVNGKYSKEQKEIYDIVLKANKECIKKIKPGIRFSSLRDLSEKILAEGLFKAGILKNKKLIRKYSLHGLGHHIGLDTHDAVSYGKTVYEDNDTLRAGNVLTIEPGLYFPSGSKDIAKKYWGIAVRIEDDILVKRGGYENLTEGLEKETGEIEEIMGSK